MTISQQTIKLLWGRAASRCAFPDCRIQLTQNSKVTSNSFPVGEQAHIVAKEMDGPRGDSLLTPNERDSYSNLILLCPNHHAIIDKNPQDFPVEKLYAIKTNHELWVQETLSQTGDLNQQADDLIYANIIDLAVQYCHLSSWEDWTFGPLEPIPRWPLDLPKEFLEFRKKVLCTDFPGTLVELERAIITLSILLGNAATVFQKNCEIEENYQNSYIGIRFYKIREWNPPRYKELLKEFNDWVEECHQLIFEATKAANWFREVVRRDINPMFFVTEGKFMATYPWSSGDLGLSHQYLLLEYSKEEKDELPDSLII